MIVNKKRHFNAELMILQITAFVMIIFLCNPAACFQSWRTLSSERHLIIKRMMDNCGDISTANQPPVIKSADMGTNSEELGYEIRSGLKVAVVADESAMQVNPAEKLAKVLGVAYTEAGRNEKLEAQNTDSGLVIGGFKPSTEGLKQCSELLEQMDFILHVKKADQDCSNEEQAVSELLSNEFPEALLEVDSSSGDVEETLNLALTLIEFSSTNEKNEDNEIMDQEMVAELLNPGKQEAAVVGSEDEAKAEKERQRLLSKEGAMKRREEKETRRKKKQESRKQTDDTEEVPFYMRFNEKPKVVKKEMPPVVPSQLEAVLEDPEDDTPDDDLEFGPFVLKKHLAKALRRAKILSPTPIQEAAMKRVLEGEDILIHSETGSGKTLSYLLPLMRDLQWQNSQQIMIVTPSRELAVQVAREAAALMAGRTDLIKLVVDSSFSGEKKGHPVLRTERPVIVGTARQLKAAIDTDSKRAASMMRKLKTVVFDEVDRLLDPLSKYATPKEIRQRQRHPKAAAAILKDLYEINSDIQFVGCSATVGRKLRREVLDLMDGSETASLSEGPQIVRAVQVKSGPSEDQLRAVEVPTSIDHWYLPLVEDTLEDRLNALMVTVLSCAPEAPLVFIPRDAKISEVVKSLREMGLTEAIPLHEAMGFADAKPGTNAILTFDKLTSLFKSRSEGERPPLLVTSEDTARGLHFEQVDFVFLLKKPKSPDEYLHLAGRTGRQGKKGTVISIVSYREAKSIQSWEKQLGIKLHKKNFLE
mmetsp:Transcript_2953/g.3876  ORF Transcript_2953/g.3876 Transcript_2953/m.3876 type:complete len:759 (+) Transcript_2953:90-2366(+)